MSERVGAGVIEPRLLGRPYTYPIPAQAVPHLGHGKHLCHLVEDMGIAGRSLLCKSTKYGGNYMGKEQFVGVWKLVSAVWTRSDGKAMFPSVAIGTCAGLDYNIGTPIAIFICKIHFLITL